MTREEAIVLLKDEANYKKDYPYDRQAFEMAIKALEQERNEWIEMLTKENERLHMMLEQKPCEDAISREAVLSVIDGWYEQNRDTENIEDLIILITYMSSVQPIMDEARLEKVHKIALINYRSGRREALEGIKAEIKQCRGKYFKNADGTLSPYMDGTLDRVLAIINKYCGKEN